MGQASASRDIQLHIEGGVSGQLAVGDYNIQIGEVHGGVVNIIAPDKKPSFSEKARPIFMRPHPFPGLLDRTEELGTAFEALKVSESVSVHGQSGLGKTALLRYLSYKSPGDNFPDGIVYLAARNSTVDDLLQVIFDSFYESDRTAKPSMAELHQRLQNVCALILLDDAALEYDQVSELINSLPQCVFVFASVERCLWGEGRCISLGGLPTQEALLLIERELGRSLQGSEISIAEAFCQKAHGHPLQIIQAAALVRQGKTFTEIGDTFCESEDAFTRYILAQLTAPQRRVLAVLAASGNLPISVDHLAGISQLKDLGAHLKPLLDDHLIQANSPAYNLTGSLAPSIRQIADLAEAEKRVLDYFVEWLRQNPAVSEVTDSLDLLLSLTERAKSQGRWKEVISLGRGVEKALIFTKRWQAWSQVLDSVLSAAVAIGDRAIHGWALHELGTRHLCLGNLEPARQSLTEALEIRHALGDEAGAAVTQHNLGLIAAPPAPPRHPPRSKPGPAASSGGSSVFKIILGLVGIGILAAAGVVLWNLIRPPQPTPTSIVVPPPVFTNTFTFTPRPSGTPRSTNTPLPTKTKTPTRTPSRTPTRTPSQTPMPTATGSISIEKSTDLVYYGGASCNPQEVTITVRASAPNGITVVDLFYRFDYSGGSTGWNDVAMKPIGSDLYERVLNPTALLGNSVSFQQATLKYQVVIQQNNGDTTLRTPVMSDIVVQFCADPTATNTPDLTPPPAPAVIGPKDNVVVGCPLITGENVFLQWTEPYYPAGISGYTIDLGWSFDGNNWNGQYVYKPNITKFEITDFINSQFNQCQDTGTRYFKWRIQALDKNWKPGDWSEWAYFNAQYIK